MNRAANDNQRLPQSVLNQYATALSRQGGWVRNGLLAFFGVMVTLALAPFFAFPLLWLAFPSLLWLLITAPTARRAFWDGWWFGFGFFVSGLYWFAYALLVDAAKFAWLIPFAVFGISALLSIYVGLVGWLVSLTRGRDRFAWPFALATIWTMGEWLRGFLFTGFPWNLVGNVFNASEVSLQSAALLGAYGLSWVAVFVASLPVVFMPLAMDRRSRDGNGNFMLAVLLLPALLLSWGYWRLAHAPSDYQPGVTFRIVQAGIDQYKKWQPDERIKAIQKYASMTLSDGYKHITHVVWPETAMTYTFSSGDYWAKELSRLVPRDGLLFTGVIRPETSTDGKIPLHIYNSLRAVDGKGEVVFSYDKRKLVPFGEFVPFRTILPLDKITPGALDFSSGLMPGRVSLPDTPALYPLICYEVIFPELSHGAWPATLLNITNDAWFGVSTGPYQHLEMSRMRAVEQGVPLIRAANSGVSAVIDPYGRTVASLGLNKVGVLDAPMPKPLPAPSPYALYGDQLLVLLLLFGGLTLFMRPRSAT